MDAGETLNTILAGLGLASMFGAAVFRTHARSAHRRVFENDADVAAVALPVAAPVAPPVVAPKRAPALGGASGAPVAVGVPLGERSDDRLK